ncbi:MAG: hypothetical protein FWF57_06130 [Defluviitaleaceae bacterium]|nr:hypothetical protein [Defluviitaleaceae bacterium]
MNKFFKKSLLTLVAITPMFSLANVYALDNNQVNIDIVNEINNFDYEEREYTDFNGEVNTRDTRNNILLLNNEEVWGNSGTWERSFQTLNREFGSRLNVWHRNNTPRPVIVRVERRVNNAWILVTNFTVPANDQNTRQIAMLSHEFNQPMRITVSNASGASVNGVVSIRQTNNPL